MKRFIKLIMCIISVWCIFVSMCPISAFAVPDSYFPVPMDKPTVTDYSGYVELLFEHKSTGQQLVKVLSWFFTPALNTSSEYYLSSDKPILTIVRNSEQFRLGVATNDGVSGNISFMIVDTLNELYLSNMTVPDDSATYYFNLTLGSSYSLVGMHYYGDFSSVNVDNSLVNSEFYVTYGSDTVVCYGLNQIISAIYSLIDITGQSHYADELQSIIDKLNSIDTSVDGFRDDFNLSYNQLLSWLRQFLEGINKIVDNTDEIESKLDEIWSLLYDIDTWVYYIYEYMPWMYTELIDIHSLLQQILNSLSSEGSLSEKLTQPDNSDMDNYYDVENGLLDNGNADINGAVNVQVNQNAMSVIWDLVESALNSHAKVIGMVLTILALGIVALILGR